MVRDYDTMDRVVNVATIMRLKAARPLLPESSRIRNSLSGIRLRHRRLPESFRWRAAQSFLADTALARDTWWNVYAIEYLPEMLGDDALPLLIKIVKQDGGRISGTVGSALRDLGGRAVPFLVSMLEDEANPQGQLDAVDSLGFMGSGARAATPALARALRAKKGIRSGTLTVRLEAGCAWALGQIGRNTREAVQT